MAGLDPKGRENILALLEQIRRESGCTIIMISHSMDDIARHATKVLVLEKGEIAMLDTPQNVFSHADKLESLGLSVPNVTKICTEMNKRGISIPTTICTEAALLDWFKGVKRHA
jgi:energy-coupling factor transport system ATP-binding protein